MIYSFLVYILPQKIYIGMYIFTQKGPSINDVIHYRGNLLKSDVTPYISYLLKWVTRGQKSQ